MKREPCPLLARGVSLRSRCETCAATGTTDGTRRARGEILFRQGDPATSILALTAGLARLSVTTADGRAHGARLVRSANLLGLEALAAGAPVRQATATVVRTARVCAVPIAEVRAWLEGHPGAATALATVAVSELMDVQRRLVTNASLTAEERVLDLVRELSRETAPGAWTELPATREQLGEMLGLTLETVSRMLHRLAARGAIEIDGRRVRMCARRPSDP